MSQQQNHHRHDHIADALTALTDYAAHPAPTYSDSELLLALTDLAALAKRIGELADQSRAELSAWATVAPHLVQAREHATNLARSLRHAGGTLAFNATHQPTVVTQPTIPVPAAEPDPRELVPVPARLRRSA